MSAVSRGISPPKRRSRNTTPDATPTSSDAGKKDEEPTWSFKPAGASVVRPPEERCGATLSEVVFRHASVGVQPSEAASSTRPALLPKPVTTNLLPTYKILLIGDAAVGKSNLLSRLASNTFDIASRSTIGVEFVSREVELPTERDGSMERVNIQLWDTAGQERCGAISAAFFRGAKGVAVVYDCTRYATLKNVPGWVAHAKKYADENCSFVVIGNKIDLKNLQAVSEDDAESVAHSLGLRHFYASALSGEGVPAAFLHLILSVNSLMRSQHIASPMIAGGGANSRLTTNNSPSRNVTGRTSIAKRSVDISGFGNTGESRAANGRSSGSCCK